MVQELGADYSERRCQAFLKYAEGKGHSVHVYCPRGRRRITGVRQSEQHGLIYEDAVAPWIASLPKPVGIMACDDVRGHQVLNACCEVQVAVPEEVAVIGVDNYDVLCVLSTPPLSSIDQNTRRIARRAATILEELMDGKRASEETELVEPARLTTRQSSDVLAIDDPDIVQTLRFIRQHAALGIRVTDVAVCVGGQEREFKGRTFLDPQADLGKGLAGKREKHEVADPYALDFCKNGLSIRLFTLFLQDRQVRSQLNQPFHLRNRLQVFVDTLPLTGESTRIGDPERPSWCLDD